MGWILLLLVVNTIISILNAVCVGRMWSEAKAIGGFIRVLAVAGYIMAASGFTMVYGMILLLLAPHIIPLIPALNDIPIEEILILTLDMMYLLLMMAILPTGLIIWFNSLVHFWRKKTLVNGLVLGWNTYAQIRNMASAARNVPSVLQRITKALFGGRKRGSAIAAVAIFIVILAVIGGWLTTSAIVKKADQSHDGFDGLERVCKNPKVNEMRAAFKKMTMPQKEMFIRNLDEQLKGSKSSEFRGFLNECIAQYNLEAKSVKN